MNFGACIVFCAVKAQVFLVPEVTSWQQTVRWPAAIHCGVETTSLSITDPEFDVDNEIS